MTKFKPRQVLEPYKYPLYFKAERECFFKAFKDQLIQGGILKLSAIKS